LESERVSRGSTANTGSDTTRRGSGNRKAGKAIDPVPGEIEGLEHGTVTGICGDRDPVAGATVHSHTDHGTLGGPYQNFYFQKQKILSNLLVIEFSRFSFFNASAREYNLFFHSLLPMSNFFLHCLHSLYFVERHPPDVLTHGQKYILGLKYAQVHGFSEQ